MKKDIEFEPWMLDIIKFVVYKAYEYDWVYSEVMCMFCEEWYPKHSKDCLGVIAKNWLDSLEEE